MLKTKVHVVHVGLSQPPEFLKLIGLSKREVPQIFPNNNSLIVQPLTMDVMVDGLIKLLLILIPMVLLLNLLIHTKQPNNHVKLTQVLTKPPTVLLKLVLPTQDSKVLLTVPQSQFVLMPPPGNLINQVS